MLCTKNLQGGIIKSMKPFFALAFLAVLLADLIPASSFALIKLNLNYPEFGNITFDKAECEALPPGKVCGQNPNALIAWIYYFIVGIAGLAAFVMLVWGGVQWLTSGAIPSQAGEARDKIKNAIIGLLLVLASFLIIQVLNPELTIIGLSGLDPQSRKAPPYGEGIEGDSVPPGQTRAGIYLCKEDNCAGEFVYIDHTVDGCEDITDFKNIPDKCTPDTSWPKDQDWNDKVGSVRMNEVKEVFPGSGKLERKDVFLSEDSDGNGRLICIKGSVDKLDLIQLHVGFLNVINPDIGWANKASSMLTAFRKNFQCVNPGITLRTWTDASNDNPVVVFLFNEIAYGERPKIPVFTDPKFLFGQLVWNQRKFAIPLEVWKQSDSPIFEKDRKDLYGEGRLNTDIFSVWITGEPVCGPSNDQPCAVRFWDHSGVDTDGDGKKDIFDSGLANICFTSSEPDLTTYSFEYNPDDNTRSCTSAENDMRDDIRGIQIIPAEDCPIPKKVFNCNR